MQSAAVRRLIFEEVGYAVRRTSKIRMSVRKGELTTPAAVTGETKTTSECDGNCRFHFGENHKSNEAAIGRYINI